MEDPGVHQVGPNTAIFGHGSLHLILISWLDVEQVIVDSLNRTDLDLRKNLYGNIILSGGSTLCRGEDHNASDARQTFEC